MKSMEPDGKKVFFNSEKGIFVERAWPFYGPESECQEIPIGSFRDALQHVRGDLSRVDFLDYDFPIEDIGGCGFLSLDFSKSDGVSEKRLKLARFLLAEESKELSDPGYSEKPYYFLVKRRGLNFDPNDFPNPPKQNPLTKDNAPEGLIPMLYISDLHLEKSIDLWHWVPHAKEAGDYKGCVLTRQDAVQVITEAASMLKDSCGGFWWLLMAGNLCDSLEIASLFFQTFEFFGPMKTYFALGPDELSDLSPNGERLGHSPASIYDEYKKELSKFGVAVIQDEILVRRGYEGDFSYSADEVVAMSQDALDSIFFGADFAILGSTGDSNDEAFKKLYRTLVDKAPSKKVIVLTSYPLDEEALPIVPGWEYVSGQKNDLSVKRENLHHDGGVGFYGKGKAPRRFFIKENYDFIRAAREGITPITAGQYQSFWFSNEEFYRVGKPYRSDQIYLLKKSGVALFAQRDAKGGVYWLDRGKRHFLQGLSLERLLCAVPTMASILQNALHPFQQKLEKVSGLMDKYFQGGKILAPAIWVTIKEVTSENWTNFEYGEVFVDPITLRPLFFKGTRSDSVDRFYGSFEELLEYFCPTALTKMLQDNGGMPNDLKDLFEATNPEADGFEPDWQEKEEGRFLSGKELSEWQKAFRRLFRSGNDNLLTYFDESLVRAHPQGDTTMEELLSSFFTPKVTSGPKKPHASKTAQGTKKKT